MALARKNRLIKKKDFDTVFSLGESFFTQSFQIKYLDNKVNLRRFGFIISSKYLKKAVDRNRLKRIISENIRENIDLFPKSIDLVIILKSAVKDIDSDFSRSIIKKIRT